VGSNVCHHRFSGCVSTPLEVPVNQAHCNIVYLTEAKARKPSFVP